MTPVRFSRAFVACALVAGLVVAACGGSGDSAAPTPTATSSGASAEPTQTPEATSAATATATTTPAPTPTEAAPAITLALPEAAANLDGLYQELLGLIPDTEESRVYVGIANFALLMPSTTSTRPLSRRTLRLGMLTEARTPGTWCWRTHRWPGRWKDPRTSAVWTRTRRPSWASILAIAESIRRSRRASPPPSTRPCAANSIRSLRCEAIKSCAECQPPVANQHAGIIDYTWGDDFKQDLRNRLTPPVFDSIGRGGHYVIDEQYLLHALWTEGINGMIDAWQDEATSLQANEAFRVAAEHIEALGAFSATFSSADQLAALLDDTASRSGNTYAVAPDELVAPDVDAAANGLDAAGEPYLALVRVYESADVARGQADVLTALFSDAAFTEDARYGRVEVQSEADGGVLTLLLRFGE